MTLEGVIEALAFGTEHFGQTRPVFEAWASGPVVVRRDKPEQIGEATHGMVITVQHITDGVDRVKNRAAVFV